jgi:hypothetical protein
MSPHYRSGSLTGYDLASTKDQTVIRLVGGISNEDIFGRLDSIRIIHSPYWVKTKSKQSRYIKIRIT